MGGVDEETERYEVREEPLPECAAKIGGSAHYSDARCENDTMRCSLMNHPLGFELMLLAADLVRSQVCRSADEVLSARRMAATLTKGWSE